MIKSLVVGLNQIGQFYEKNQKNNDKKANLKIYEKYVFYFA